MKSLKFKTVSDREEARIYWDMFSPYRTIDHEWDFREVFGKELDLPLHFIVGFDNDQPIGLLPLQFNTMKGLGPKLLNMQEPFYEFFGGIDTDDNKVLLKENYQDLTQLFLQQIKSPVVLTSLTDIYKVNSTEAVHYLDRYELDLKKIGDFDTLLQTNFDGKSRQRLINRLNNFSRNFVIEVKKGIEADLQLLFEFSIKRFGERSSFNMKHRQEIYKELLKRFNIDLFIIFLNGKPAAISFGIVHKGIYTTVNIGYDYDIRDISKLLVVTQIKRAFELGCTTFDAGQGDNGWKEHFHLRKIPQYKLVL